MKTSDDEKRGSNPRYVAYARFHGRSPAEMLEHDRAAWPGGCMCGFMLWISAQLTAFYAAHPDACVDRYTVRDQNAWTAFLESVARNRKGRPKHATA